MAKDKNKAELLAEGVKKAVGAGRSVAVETVDFSDPDRPLTCLEVDFPIIPINRLAAIEATSGAAKKPIYQISKWFARRPSSVFRSMLLAAGTKAPSDPLEASKAVWELYYANHQTKGSYQGLKVLDPFMGGGTTLVEGARLGFDLTGVDLNPVAWFIVKTELAAADRAEVEALLLEVENEVKPQLMPYYAADCPRGHKGKWTKVSTGEILEEAFDPLALPLKERNGYSYQGPEVVYVFWAKHGPCQITGCGHRTPIVSRPVVASKNLSIGYWEQSCSHCEATFDLEEKDARLAPSATFIIADTEKLYSVLNKTVASPGGQRVEFKCPSCGGVNKSAVLSANPPKRKKIELSILVHPSWLAGELGVDSHGNPLGGSSTDSPASNARWNLSRARQVALLEVRGKLPPEVTDPVTGLVIATGSEGGTSHKKATFSCGACGKENDLLTAVRAFGKSAPIAAYAMQVYCPICAENKEPCRGRYFVPMVNADAINGSDLEWNARKDTDLAGYWPNDELSFGWRTHHWAIPEHGYTHYWKMFGPQQLLGLSVLLQSISKHLSDKSRGLSAELLLAAFQQLLRLNNQFTIWHQKNNQTSAFLSNPNFQPKSMFVETFPFASVGDGSWNSALRGLVAALKWKENPWELVTKEGLEAKAPDLAKQILGKTHKTFPEDKLQSSWSILNASATNLDKLDTSSTDLVITDPPFGSLVQYAELADFFYVWLRLVLREKYPQVFGPEYCPKSLEVVENPARNPDEPGNFYQRLLNGAWMEAHRVLKPAGILAFTFHHNEDEPWVQVLESLFDAGFYLIATYPIRCDEIKGENDFGSKKVEYDIIHVCRKRDFEPKPVSWARMRRQISNEVRRLQSLLEHHQKDGLPSADIEVIKRGKALEYYSKHYGQVFEAEGHSLSVKDAVLGVLQVLEESSTTGAEPPPVTASPYTRQLMRMFQGSSQQPLDQVQKYLRGTGISPVEFEDRGWLREEKKVYYLTPFPVVALAWQGRQRASITYDYDQAAVLIGACFDGSGIKAEDTLSNTNFKPHPALGALLQWFAEQSSDSAVRTAAGRADRLYRSWLSRNSEADKQLSLFGDDGDDA